MMCSQRAQGGVGWKSRVGLFLAGQTVSLFGSSLVQYAIVWHIARSTGSGRFLALSTVCAFVPQLAVSLCAGAWLDRVSRKTLILYADGMIACATAVLAVLWHSDQALWMLFAALAVRSAGTGLQAPAVLALLPQLTPSAHLARVNGLHGALNALTTFLAPAASALLLGWLPLSGVFLVDVLTAAVGMGVLGLIPVPRLARATTVSALAELREGFACVQTQPRLRRLFGFQAAVLMLISPAAFLTPLLVSRLFGSELTLLAASEMTYSAGAVLGGLLMAVWGGGQDRLRTVCAAGCLYGVGMIAMGLAPTFLCYLLCNALMGLVSPCYSAAFTTHIQETVPAALHGRVFSLLQIAGSCSFPLGMLFSGPLSDTYPLGWILTGCGVAVLLLAVGMARSRARL